MIKDAESLKQATNAWILVRGTQARFELSQAVGIVHLAFPDPEVEKLTHNLLLILAYSVLEDVLLQLKDEGVISSSSSKLGALMIASQTKVPWKDFARVDAGRDRRNKVAHDSELLPSNEVSALLDLIENELVAWGILEGRITIPYTWEIKPTS